MLLLGEGHKDYVPSAILSRRIADYNEQLPSMLPYLESKVDLHEINCERSFNHVFKDICKLIEPVVVHIRAGPDSLELRDEIIKNLIEKEGYVNLDVNSLIRDENER